jgi:hypothetical protein
MSQAEQTAAGGMKQIPEWLVGETDSGTSGAKRWLFDDSKLSD